MLVVEDDAGEIVGCWSLLSVIHVEGLWIRPDHRQHGSVGRALLTTMQRWIRQEGVDAVVTASTNGEMADYLDRLGALPIPGQTFLWPMRES